jgi:hypothetical protein
MGRDLGRIAIFAMNGVDKFRLGRPIEVSYLDQLKDWLCEISCHLSEIITAGKFLSTQHYDEAKVVSPALGYDLTRPQHGDTIGSIFPNLHRRLTANLCVLQSICDDQSAEIDEYDIEMLLRFCIELSKSLSANRPDIVSRLAA